MLCWQERWNPELSYEAQGYVMPLNLQGVLAMLASFISSSGPCSKFHKSFAPQIWFVFPFAILVLQADIYVPTSMVRRRRYAGANTSPMVAQPSAKYEKTNFIGKTTVCTLRRPSNGMMTM